MRRMGTADAAEIAKFNALLHAVTEHPESVAALVQESSGILEVVNSAAETVLHWLAVENDVEGVRLLHGLGAEIPLFALIHAVQHGHIEMVELLLELGARPETYDLSRSLNNPIFGLTQSQKEDLTSCFRRYGILIPILKIEDEASWLVSQTAQNKSLFFARLGFAITLVGRNSYTVGQDGLDKPEQLRKINEIQHRIYACLCKLLAGSCEPSFEGSIANWVLNQQEPELHALLVNAWTSTKDDFQRE